MNLAGQPQLVSRAMAAWFRSPSKRLVDPDGWNIKDISGRLYVSLHSGLSTLAVYRVRTDGILKRLKRWPIGVGASSE